MSLAQLSPLNIGDLQGPTHHPQLTPLCAVSLSDLFPLSIQVNPSLASDAKSLASVHCSQIDSLRQGSG